MVKFLRHDPKRVLILVASVIVASLLNLLALASPQTKKETKEKTEQRNPFVRPEPSRPIKPYITPTTPGRYTSDKVFLERADSLYRRDTYDMREHQVVKGNVLFRQGGVRVYCDSAYFYPEFNSMDAFGHVRLEQGDTLFVYADKAFYNGDSRLVKLRCGASQPEVRLINRKTKLTTDSLDYDMSRELGWYAYGGRLEDEINRLTSDYGEYSPRTKDADFYFDVLLVNTRDNFRMITDTLYYNTESHLARIASRTVIEGENDTIRTSAGIYNTNTGNAELTSRSIMAHKDSSDNVVTLEGDSIIYDKATRITRAYMFRDPSRIGRPMVLTDTARKSTLIGGFGIYNDSTREATASDYPLLMEYSRPDTLFLRADTILTFIRQKMVPPPVEVIDSLARIKYEQVRAAADSITAAADSVAVKAQETPNIQEDAADSIDAETVIVEDDPEFLNEDITEADTVRFHLDEIDIDSLLAQQDETPPVKQNRMEAGISPPDELAVDSTIFRALADSISKDSTLFLPKDYYVARAYNKARFFRQDIQGVADTMIYEEADSMLYLMRKPVVWNEGRQVYGNRINIHLNDSTADWALLPEFGMIGEYVGEEFYNQLTGKTIKAFLKDGALSRLEVEGNVQLILLPEENDSTYNKIVAAESSNMTVDLDEKGATMERMKMWPEVSGTVTPLFLVKNSQLYLPGFRWLEAIRPRREWYGGRWHWADDLGDTPDELDDYFNDPTPLLGRGSGASSSSAATMAAPKGLQNQKPFQQ